VSPAILKPRAFNCAARQDQRHAKQRDGERDSEKKEADRFSHRVSTQWIASMIRQTRNAHPVANA
jgi:hypothetical protein